MWFGLELCVYVFNFDELACLLVQVLYLKLNLLLLHLGTLLQSIRDLCLNTISGFFDDIDDPPIRYGFIVICSDSAACSI